MNINELYMIQTPQGEPKQDRKCFFLNSFHTRLFQKKPSGTLPEPPLNITTLTPYGICTCFHYSLELTIIIL